MIAMANKAANNLINKDIKPERLACTEPPIVAINVVTHVPMVAPKAIYRALENPIAPLPTITITIPVVALLDCTNAVNTIPTSKSKRGKSIDKKRF